MITKVLNVYTKDKENAKLVMTFRTENVKSDVLVKEEIATYHPKFPKTRYRGNTPIIFIRLEDVEDFEFLEFVNRLRLYFDNNDEIIKTVDDILDVLDIHLGKDKIALTFNSFEGDEGYVALRRPYASFRPFTNKMFTDAAESIVESTMSGINAND